MRIHSIAFENLRGVEHLVFDDIPDTGVIVVSGPNEQGKTTIMDAVHLALREKHGSKKAELYAMQPAGKDVGISVTLSATVGPYTFTIAKTFLKGLRSELTVTRPRHEQVTGRQADQRLAEILAEHLDDDLARALYLRQDTLSGQFEAAGIPSLDAALKQSAGQANGDESRLESGLMQAVDSECSRYYTPSKGTPTGELKAAIDRLARAQESCDRAAERRASLAGYVDDVARHAARRDDAAIRLPAARDEVARRVAEVEQAEGFEQRAERAHEVLAAAQAACEVTSRDLADRQSLVDQLAQQQATLDDLMARQAPVLEQATQQSQRLADLKATRDAATIRYDAAATAVNEARVRHHRAQAAARIDEIRGLLDRVAQLDADARAARQEAPATLVTDADLLAIDACATELDVQRRLRSAIAPKLLISGPASSAVGVDGEPLTIGDEPTPVELTHGMRLTFGDIDAEVVATTDLDGVRAAERALRQALERVACESPDAARQAHERGKATARLLDELVRRRDGELRGTSVDAAQRELAELTDTLDGVESSELDEVRDAEGLRRAAERVTAAEADAQQADAERRLAEAALAGLVTHSASDELTRLQALSEATARDITARRDDLARRELDVPLDSLVKAHADASSVRDRAQRAADDADAALAAADLEQLREELAGAQEQQRSLDDTLRTSELTLAGLNSHIEAAEGAAEEFDRALGVLENARRQERAVRQRAEAAARLREVLQQHRDAARRSYAGPFTTRLAQLARIVFGHDVDFELNDSLQVVTRSLHDTSLGLANLSTGAQEQLAIITRFAAASLVAGDDDVPVPVFVDDALGSTDPERLTRMARLFSRLGRQGQVFVMTCFPQRYERVTGKIEYAIEDLKRDTRPPA